MHIRRIFTIASLVLCATSSMAQNRYGIGVHFGGYDFYGPQTKKYFFTDRYKYTYNEESRSYDSSTQKRILWKPVVSFSGWAQINKHIDLSGKISFANLQYPGSRPDSNYINTEYYNAAQRNERIMLEFDARFNYNIIPKEDYLLSPYLFTGITGAYHDVYFGANIPVGLGVNVNIAKDKDLYLNLESAYKIAATDNDQNHLQHSIGLVYWFKPGYKEPKAEKSADMPPPPVPVLDADGDGINDDADDCPSIAGTEQFNGCPDSDGDGVSDKDDACPLVAGTAQFNGCPDSDGDGVNDKDDKCPYVAGIASREGCPIPDKDGDGFNDDNDRCPDVYSKTNNGCPEIRKEVITQVEKAAKAIFFETGKATIKKNSFKSLDAVVRVLKSDATLYADVEGHTDDVGDDASNMTLSQNRAQAVVDYIVSKGIDASRLTAQGFGETQPVADNGSAAGRAQNRRTVIQLRNYSK